MINKVQGERFKAQGSKDGFCAFGLAPVFKI
jgi:hypothetical protein